MIFKILDDISLTVLGVGLVIAIIVAAWLWQHWGTIQALRHVAPQWPSKSATDPAIVAGNEVLRFSFWAADWTPWRAF